MSKRNQDIKAERAFVDDTEQEMYDAVAAAINAYVNVVERQRAANVVSLLAEMVEHDETWVTYEGGPVPPEPPALPTLTSLSPNTAVAGAPDDIVMSAIGTGFTPQSIIVFNGFSEPTTFVSDTEVTTGVKPSLFVVPAVCPVEVHTGTTVSGPIDFTFTEAVARKVAAKDEKADDSKGKQKKNDRD
jgi:hypothetical protein